MATKSKRSVITGLTVQEENFCELIAKGYDSLAARDEALGVGKGSRLTRTKAAGALARKDHIVRYIEQLREKTRERGRIDRDEMVDWLKDIAEFGKAKQIRTNKYETFEALKDGAAANSAIDKLLKIGGLYAAEKIEVEKAEKVVFNIDLSENK